MALSIRRWVNTGTLGIVIAAAVPGLAQGQHWRGTWGASSQMTLAEIPDAGIADFAGKTIRQVVRISAGGERIRLRLSNELSGENHRISNVTVALARKNGAIDPASLREVTFGGLKSIMLGAGAPFLSDPIDFPVDDLSLIAITQYFPEQAKGLTVHSSAYATAWVVEGDQTKAADLGHGQAFMRRIMISGVEVEAAEERPVIVTLGDSITDGTRTTIDANRRWPDRLAERLHAVGKTGYAVVNAGIGGNRVLRQSRSPSALARFDRDVLSVPGVSHLVVLEGVNDLGNMMREGHRVSASDLITGYRQIIRRAEAHDIKVYLATIIPYKGAAYWSEEGESVRKEVNAWVRTQQEAEGFFDFDKAIADPSDPDRIAKAFDIGDGLHPNDAGMQAIADAVDLSRLH